MTKLLSVYLCLFFSVFRIDYISLVLVQLILVLPWMSAIWVGCSANVLDRFCDMPGNGVLVPWPLYHTHTHTHTHKYKASRRSQSSLCNCLPVSGCSEGGLTVGTRMSIQLMLKRLKVPASEHFEFPVHHSSPAKRLESTGRHWDPRWE